MNNEQVDQNEIKAIEGAGGGKGGGGGGAVESPNTISSRALVKVIEVLSEGEIVGIAGGAQGIYINDTPLQNVDDSYNFARSLWDYRVGLPDQDYMQGFSAVEAEITVGTVVTTATSVTRTTTAANIDAVRVTINLPQGLYSQDTTNGNMNGTTVSFAIDRKLTSSGTWVQVGAELVIEGKTTTASEKQYRIDRPAGAGTWDVRVRRVTADSALSALRNQIAVARITEIQDVKLSYNDTAYVGLSIDAESVGNKIPKRSYLVKGIKVKIPNNYNPVTRIYTGIWNGTFTTAWTDNPAWILYDLITHPRYGMGEFIAESRVDKFSFYDAGVYNDGLVPDGNGGYEPRFTFNGVLNTREEAFRLLTLIAGMMRGSLIDVNGQIKLLQDRPTDYTKLITKANVIDGKFDYRSTGLLERHTAFNVSFNDRADRHLQRTTTIDASTAADAFQTMLQTAEDRYGYHPTDIAAMGATTEGQAIRHGMWALDTELNQTELVQFKMSLNGLDITAGDIVKIWDEDYVAATGGGRIVSVSGTTVVIDRPVTFAAGSKIDVTLADGRTIEQRNIVQTSGTSSTFTIATAFSTAVLPGADYVLTLAASARQFRVMGLRQEEANVISIEALYHDPNKFSRVEFGLNIPAPIFSLAQVTTCNAPTGLTFREVQMNNASEGLNGLRRSLLLSWITPTQGIVKAYQVRYRLGKSEWVIAQPKGPSFEINPAFGGTYEVDVSAISMQDNVGPAVAGSYNITTTGGGASVLDAPTTLQIIGGGTSFTGLDINFQWTNPASNATELNATLRDFEVRFIETSGSTTVRTVYVPAVAAGSIQTSSYTFTMNTADGGPRRTMQIQVRCRDAANNLSDPATVTFSNPAPATVASISAVGGIGNIKITYTKPTDSDYAGVLLWRSTTTGFTPSSGNFIYDTRDNYISDQVDFGTTYFYKAAAYDTFSRPLDGAGLNISAQFSASALAGEGIPEVATLPTPAGYDGPKIVYLNTDGKLYSYVGGAWQVTIPEVSGVADASITVAKFAAGLKPIEIVATLPTTGNVEGRMVFLTSDDKLYRYNGTAFVSTVPATDVTGTLTNAQIADLAAAKITGTIATAQIADAALTTAKFASTIKPVEVLATLPTVANVAGRMVFLTTDNKLYRYNGTAFVATVPSTDITGTLTDAQLAAIAAAKITGTIATAQIADAALTTAKFASTIKPVEVLGTLPVSGNVAGRMVFLTTDSKLYRYNGTAFVATIPSTDLTGTLTDAQLSAIAAAKITGTIVGTQIADAAITTAKFASTIKPIEVLAALPGPTHIAGRTVFLTTDNKLYRNDGTAWISSVPSTDITGTLTDAQLGAIAAAKVTGQITSTQITDDAITTPKIAAGAVTANEIAASTIVAGNIAAGTITSTQIAADTITAGNIAAGAITATELAANSVIAGKIAAGAISATEIASSAITTQKLVITGNSLIANPDFATGAFTNWRLWSSPTYQSVILGSTVGVPASAPSKYVAKFEWTGASTGISTFAAEKAYSDAGAEKDGFAVTDGRQYAVSIYAAKSADYAGTFVVAVYFYKNDGTWTTNITPITASLTTSWAQYSGSFTAPAGAVRAWLYVMSNPHTAGAVFWTNLYAREKASGDLIVDGAITAVKITSGTITSTQIAADTITAANIAANAITATELNAGAVTTAKIAAGAVTANEIAANTITAGKIAVGAITATEIAAGAINASKIAAGSITTTEIAASTITGADIAATTITGGNIVAGTITANELAVNSVIAGKIAAGAVTATELAVNSVIAGKIASGVISATELAAGAVTTAKLAVGAVTANELAANSVTAVKILAGTITGDRLLANTITSSQIAADTITAGNIAANAITSNELAANAVIAGKIQAGAISAAEIAAGAITTSKLAVTNNSAINVDPGLQDSSLWVTESGSFTIQTVSDAPVGTRVLRTTAGAQAIAVDSTYYPIDSTKSYRFRFWTRSVGANGVLYQDLRQYTDIGATCATNSGRSPYKPSNITYAPGWTEHSNTWGPGDWQPGVKFVRLDFLLNYGGTAGYVEMCNPRLTEMATGELIVDGTITALKIAAGTITGNEIAANAITAGKILASTITSSQIAANTIIAGNIASNAITADKILAGEITANKMATGIMSADNVLTRGLTVRDALGNVILSAGVPLPSANITPSAAWLNSNVTVSGGAIQGIGSGAGTVVANSAISVNANGTLSGAGGGAVTIGGLGYTGSLNATNDLKLIPRVYCYVNGNTIGRAGGVQDWNSDVYSASPIAFGCFAQATIPDASYVIMFGLNSDPTTDASYTSIDYAMYFAAGAVYKYESGGGTHLGTYSAGATGQVIYDGSYIRYLLNGVQIGFTYIGNVNTPFYFDSSFHTQTSSLTDVRFMPYGNPSAVSVGNPIAAGNITTYISGAAIGDAQIGNLAAGKITAGTIASNVIHAGSLSAVSGTLGALTVVSGGNIKSGQGSYNSGTGFYLGTDSGTPRFSIGNSAGANMRWDGSNLYINNSTFEAFSSSIPGGDISAAGSYGSYLYGSRAVSVSGGKAGYTYAWFLTGSQNCWLTGATSSTCNVYGANDGAPNSGTVVCLVRDSNGRCTFTSFNFYGSHSASPYSGGGF